MDSETLYSNIIIHQLYAARRIKDETQFTETVRVGVYLSTASNLRQGSHFLINVLRNGGLVAAEVPKRAKVGVPVLPERVPQRARLLCDLLGFFCGHPIRVASRKSIIARSEYLEQGDAVFAQLPELGEACVMAFVFCGPLRETQD